MCVGELAETGFVLNALVLDALVSILYQLLCTKFLRFSASRAQLNPELSSHPIFCIYTDDRLDNSIVVNFRSEQNDGMHFDIIVDNIELTRICF